MSIELNAEGNPLGQELKALGDRYYESDMANIKGAQYMEEYDRILAPWRSQPLRILELGVCNGASMKIWRDYLPAATIVGLDLNPKPLGFPDDPRCLFIQGSQDDSKVLDAAVQLAGGLFDLIIDDASHLGWLTARAFSHLFVHALKPGGWYAIEDICTSFLPSFFSDGVDYRVPSLDADRGQKVFPSCVNGVIGVVKQLFDHLMAPTMLNSAYTNLDVERMIARRNISLYQKAQQK